ncbi:murein biosynthesis integral membrane protein MurJ [Brackiella oedipodis]|uniref:murein biosynthesis integral membrane protein MurJ n=1 Tax=Brackiella oedipodis TaxID=124225 RepID=UPI00048AB220|nr:murein biosynthesis integral membrane protein MurJ [Brackiella oedipodis]
MSLFKSAATISGLTLLSRISGLARDVVIARTFGSNALTDAFWVAFRIPNLLRRLFAEGAFSQAFVPILGAHKEKYSANEVKTLVDHVTLVLASVLLLVSILGAIFAPVVVWIMATGMEHSQDSHSPFASAVWMTRVMFPYIFCMSLVALASGVLNTWRKFAIPAFTPILLNLSMIASCFLWVDYFSEPIYALAVGVMIGGVLQLLVQWLALHKIGMLPRPHLRLKSAWSNPYVRRIIKQMGPATLGVSVAQISILINTNIATWLPDGSVSWLSFADRLMEFPTALLGVALGTVLLPSLSAAYARDDKQQYSHLMDWGLRLVFILGLPCMLGLALLGNGLVATLFNYGAFKAQDVAQTQTAVFAYGFGLLGILSVKILAPGFYAKQDIRTPVKIAIFVLLCTQLMNLLFVPLFKHAGLALSIGLGATLNALCLYRGLRKRQIYLPSASWLRFFMQIIPALLAMAVWLWWCGQHIVWTQEAHHGWLWQLSAQWHYFGSLNFVIWRLLLLFAVIVSSAVLYFIVMSFCGIKAKDLLRRQSR